MRWSIWGVSAITPLRLLGRGLAGGAADGAACVRGLRRPRHWLDSRAVGAWACSRAPLRTALLPCLNQQAE